jgi:hypothetical protein
LDTRPAGARDFDFLFGTWEIKNRRLLEPLTGSDEWEEFPATSVIRPVFGGAGDFDEVTFPTKGFEGLTLRLFDPEREEWSLHWASDTTGRLFPPLVGRFTDGRGEFYGDDTHKGQPVRIRFIWTVVDPERPTWEQAFSVDQGQSWETNWTMEFSRSAG